MAQLEKSIVELKAEENCLTHALIIATAKVDIDSNYDAYRKGRKIRHGVQTLLEMTGIDLTNGTGIPEIGRFQDQFREYKIVVYRGLNCDNVMFEGHADSAKRLNLLDDDVERHYHVITKLTCAMSRKYVCKCCNIACTSDVTHVCDRTCSD